MRCDSTQVQLRGRAAPHDVVWYAKARQRIRPGKTRKLGAGGEPGGEVGVQVQVDRYKSCIRKQSIKFYHDKTSILGMLEYACARSKLSSKSKIMWTVSQRARLYM